VIGGGALNPSLAERRSAASVRPPENRESASGQIPTAI